VVAVIAPPPPEESSAILPENVVVPKVTIESSASSTAKAVVSFPVSKLSKAVASTFVSAVMNESSASVPANVVVSVFLKVTKESSE